MYDLEEALSFTLTIGTFKVTDSALMRLISFMYSFNVKVQAVFVDTKEVTNLAVKYGWRFLYLYVYSYMALKGQSFSSFQFTLTTLKKFAFMILCRFVLVHSFFVKGEEVTSWADQFQQRVSIVYICSYMPLMVWFVSSFVFTVFTLIEHFLIMNQFDVTP